MATRVCSYSKINLGLAIGPVRADGFHGLATLYQTLALHDVVTVTAKPTSQRYTPVDPMSQNRDMGHPMPGSRFEVRGSREDGKRADAGRPDLAQSKITLTTNHAQVPTDASNTAWKMVELALKRANVAAEVAIHIKKNLPVQGGLGAGSANAAAALIGLERELGIVLPEAERLELAAEVGSDVPLFLIGGAVMGVGRGECVEAMPDLPATWCVVAVPEVGVSTPQAFRDWDELCAANSAASENKYEGPSTAAANSAASGRDDGLKRGHGEAGGLTSPAQPDRLEKLSHVYATVLRDGPADFGFIPETEQTPDTSGIVRGRSPERNQAGSGDGVPECADRHGEQASEQGSTWNGLAEDTLLALVRTGIENDFESVVFPQYPLLREIKRLLMGTPAGVSSDTTVDSSGNAIVAALSGSGSALFGLYRSEADARAAQQRVQASGCKALLTETLPRQEYWRRMFAE
jgi:4-diphosphocytidyl-2-C-methyl-D-erythritol kinase